MSLTLISFSLTIYPDINFDYEIHSGGICTKNHKRAHFSLPPGSISSGHWSGKSQFLTKSHAQSLIKKVVCLMSICQGYLI